MNFVQLKYFVAVCEFGTVSAAAEYLHIAQPSLSLAIKELENEFGTQLFNRVHKGMRPTNEGLCLLKMSRDIIEMVESTEKAMRDMGKNKKSLTLGIPPMIGSLLLPEIYGEFVSQNPDICINIVECGREQMVKKVMEGQIDIAFVSHDLDFEEDICAISLGALEMVCAASLDSEIAKRNTLTPKDLSGIPLVMFKEGFFQADKIKAWFSKGGVEPRVLMKTDQLSTITKLITSGTASGFVFKHLIENDKRMTFCSLTPNISVNVSLIWQRGKFFSSAMKRFKDFVKTMDFAK